MTPQQITFEVVEMIRVAFLEARKTLSNDPEADLTAWQQSEACHRMRELNKKAIQIFLQDGQ